MDDNSELNYLIEETQFFFYFPITRNFNGKLVKGNAETYDLQSFMQGLGSWR